MVLGARQRQASPSWADYFALQAQACGTPALKDFYAAGVPAEERPIGEVPLVALDFETTGMDPREHAIVSIGLVPFDLRVIRPSAGRYWVVKPPRSLREESIAFHRITHSEVEHAPPIAAILDEVLSELKGRLVVVHYRNIERPFFDAAVMANRGEHCLFPLVDTMALEARWENHGRLRGIKRLLGIERSSIRLADSRDRYGLPHYSSHHAKLDAIATAELFQAQVARHSRPSTPVSDLWI
ncbi:DNA polymerase III epsilon subunit-like 3'-5' exonuclease [Thioflavicoccus mobilis 8321]|uniref:DNA polymerase III epsilon subunit-like 3'-5' exonuclease n=1 Tax=Thioflavicoccus mobilis 8321 TaxID=765912 RepID=L0GZX4_9GAMM|nr:3'-5' exonuclease [Thioflavicoccus mobilis]AGA92318.1 DNA polymerase III epsilon subunit-like 3'-5' exonuclease [Thioflavicoccus mobilis 8321]